MDLTLIAGMIVVVIIAAIILCMVNSEEGTSPKHIALVCVSIIVLSGVTIPVISDLDNDLAPRPDFYYDDYVEANDVSSVTGAMELITVDSIPYLHANKIGSATVTYSDGSEKIYQVGKATLDVFLIAGQSNAQYYNADPDEVDPDPIMGTAYYFGTSSGPLTYAQNPYNCEMFSMNDTDGSVKIGNIEAPLAAEHYQNTHHKVYTINTGIGGRSVTDYQPGTYHYGMIREIFIEGLAKIDRDHYDVHVRSYIWVQGEADEYMEESEYISKFLIMNEAICSNAFSGPYEHPDFALIVKVRDARGQHSGPAQEYLAAHYKDIFMATRIANTFSVEAGTLDEDGTHYTQLGDNEIGVEVAKYLYKHKLY